MSKSAIDTLRGQLAQRPQEWVFWDGSARLPLFDVMCEVDAIIAERDALKARLTPPARKLREVKVPVLRHFASDPGYTVRYDADGFVFVAEHGRTQPAVPLAKMIAERTGCDWNDDVIAQCVALKDDPYEPVETVEDVLRAFLSEERLYGAVRAFHPYVARLRTAVHAEGAA